MVDQDIKDMVILHDKHIDSLATSIETLAAGVLETNHKIESMLEIMAKQNILIERMNNLDGNLRESFSRVHKRLDKLETIQSSSDGCTALKIEHQKVDDIKRSQYILRRDLDTVEDEQKTFVGGNAIRWGLVVALAYIASFGTYVITTLHDNETGIAVAVIETAKVEENHDAVSTQVFNRLVKLEEKE